MKIRQWILFGATALILASLLVLPGLGQDDADEAECGAVVEIEGEPIPIDGLADANLAGRKGIWHWKSPPAKRCKRERAVLHGPIRPCSNISIGNRKYHIKKVRNDGCIFVERAE